MSLSVPSSGRLATRRRARLAILASLIGAAGGALGANVALAANQNVLVADNSSGGAFNLPGVAVAPGETVFWSYPSGGDHHNVHFEDESFVNPPVPADPGWATMRTFQNVGAYPYFCDEHGAPGLVGMSGIVYVTQTGTLPGAPPTAAFVTSSNTAMPTQNILFNATTSSDPDGTIRRYEWDFNGDGHFEVDTATNPITTMAFTTAGTKTIGLRVTDSQALIDIETRTVTVTEPPPPAPPPPPPVTPPPAPPVTPPPPAAVTPPPPAQPAAPVSCSTLTGSARTGCMQKACRSLRGTKRATCISKSCRYVTGSKRATCIQTSCKYVSKSKRASCNRTSCRYLKGSKRRACQRKYAARRSS